MIRDEERFRALYEAHASAVLAFALRRTGRDEAREVVAETFLVAWRRLDDVPSESLPWLFGVARKVLGNRHRSSRRGRALTVRLAASEPPVQYHPDHADEISARAGLAAALEGLSDWDREALTLVAWERLDNRQAAEVMGCSTSTFAVRLHRARRRLQARLQENDHTSGGFAPVAEEAQ